MSQKNKTQLKQVNNANFPNNNSAFITPEKLRDFNTDVIDSVALDVDTQLSGSIVITGSLVTSNSVSASTYYGDGSNLSGVTATLPSGVVSGSSQINYPDISNIPSGIVSGSSQITLTDTTGNLGGNRITGSVANATNTRYVNVQPNAINSNYFPSFTNGTGENTTVYIDTTGYTYNPGQNRLTISNVSATSVTASVSVTSPTFYGDLDGNALTATNATYSQNTITTGKNLHSSEILKGTPLYFTGSGTSGNIVGVYPADAGNPSRMPAGGIAGETIAVGAEGVVLLDGFIGGVNTTGFNSGDKVYVGVGGGYTKTEPTGSALIQFLGNIEKGNSTNGSGVIQMMGESRRLPNIPQNNVWVGDVNSVPQTINKNNLGLALTGSNNQFTGTQTFNNITVNGTGSFAYIQSVTGSAKIIGDAFIILNNNTPSERYAGIVVQDSGSGSPLTTASLEFDGLNNDWFYEYSTDGGVTTDHGVVLFGPEYATKGTPTYPAANVLQKGTGGHHLTGSVITDLGTQVIVNSPFDVQGNITTTGTVDGVDVAQLNNDFNTLSSKTLVSGSSQVTSSLDGRYAVLNGNNTLVGNQVISGSIDIGPDSGDGINFYQNSLGQLRFWSGSNQSEVGTWVNLQTNPSNGALSVAAFPHNYHFVHFEPAASQSRFEGMVRFDEGIIGDVKQNLDASNNAVFIQNPNYFTEYHGTALQWRPEFAGGVARLWLSEQAQAEVLVNSFPDNFAYDHALKIGADSEGGFISDWDLPSYGDAKWLKIPQGGTPAFQRGLVVSGSVASEVKSQSISSTTASLDFSSTSLFELTLANGVDTHIDATNIGKGQTINVLITQNGTGAGTVSFSPKFLQPSGSGYTPTTALGGQDILTLMTYSDTSKIYVASVNKFE